MLQNLGLMFDVLRPRTREEGDEDEQSKIPDAEQLRQQILSDIVSALPALEPDLQEAAFQSIAALDRRYSNGVIESLNTTEVYSGQNSSWARLDSEAKIAFVERLQPDWRNVDTVVGFLQEEKNQFVQVALVQFLHRMTTEDPAQLIPPFDTKYGKGDGITEWKYLSEIDQSQEVRRVIHKLIRVLSAGDFSGAAHRFAGETLLMLTTHQNASFGAENLSSMLYEQTFSRESNSSETLQSFDPSVMAELVRSLEKRFKEASETDKSKIADIARQIFTAMRTHLVDLLKQDRAKINQGTVRKDIDLLARVGSVFGESIDFYKLVVSEASRDFPETTLKKIQNPFSRRQLRNLHRRSN